MEGKKERFKRLAEARTNKALAAIRSVAKLANKNHYEFNDEEAKAIFSAIRREVAEAQSVFSASCAKSEKKFKLD